MMVTRSKEIWLVAFFLSKFGNSSKNMNTLPPIELGVSNWNVAYRMFYDSLNQGRSRLSFEHSLKNARDSYDSIIGTSSRIGWRNEERKPIKLEKTAQEIFDEYSNADRQFLWEKIKICMDRNTFISKIVVDDLISIQELEANDFISSKTEGGKKVIVEYRYERNLKLRSLALKIHGYTCMACGFNFEEYYGEYGKEFAEVHHRTLLSEYNNGSSTNPKDDLIVLCANCHRMIHRKKGITLTLDELKQKIKK